MDSTSIHHKSQCHGWSQRAYRSHRNKFNRHTSYSMSHLYEESGSLHTYDKKKEHTILHHFTCLGEKMKTKISEFIYFVPIISLQDWPWNQVVQKNFVAVDWMRTMLHGLGYLKACSLLGVLMWDSCGAFVGDAVLLD